MIIIVSLDEKINFRKRKLVQSHVTKGFQLMGTICDHHTIFLQILNEKQREYEKQEAEFQFYL